MPPEWQRSITNLTAIVGTVVLVAFAYWARSILIPVALAIFLAFVLGPVVAWLQKRGLGRSPAVIATVGLVTVVALGTGAVVAQQTASLSETLPDRKEQIIAKLTSAKLWMTGDGSSRFGQFANEVGAVVMPKKEAPTVVVEPAQPSLPSQLDTYLSPATEVLGGAAFTFILTVFMLIRKEDLRNRMIRLLGDGKVTTTTKAVDDATKRISKFLLMQLLINTAFGAIVTVGLLLMRVEHAPLWGLIAMVMRYVPYLGTWIGLVPPTLFSLAMSDGWTQPIAVLALFLGLEAICNNVFEPWLYGASMGISEVAQLVAAGFWAFLWGPIGLILSGPLTVCFLVLGRHVRRFQFLEILLGDEAPLEPKVALYQRLAARDQDEAAEIAVAEAKKLGVEATLDKVLVPALCLARRDHDDGDLETNDFRFAVRASREIVDEVTHLREAPAEPYTGDRVRVLVCPARDDAEHAAAEAFALGLDPARWEVRVVGDETLASELVATAKEFRPAAVVLATLPPGGLSHIRYLANRLRSADASLKIAVGRWGCDDGPTRSADDLPVDGVDRSLSETYQRLAQWHSILVAAEAEPTSARRNGTVGTRAALV